MKLMRSRTPKALCLFTTILGNKATALHLQGALEQIPAIKTHCETLAVEDYRRYPAPAWARLTNPWHAQYLFQKKFGALLNGEFDLVLTNAWEFAIPLRRISRHIPSAILMDGVPHTVNEQLLRQGANPRRRMIAHALNHYPFARAIRSFRYFFPMGTGCRDALVSIYGVRADRCFVTLAPQDTARWKPLKRRELHAPARLLFVASDFLRKGGRFLMDLYARHLADACSLVIVSNDPAVGALSLPSGVTWLKGKSKEDLLEIYQKSDLFLFPSQQDYMPQVLAEALSTGLPVVSTPVGDIPDLVRSGETGILMPDGASGEQWATAIRGLIARPDELLALRLGARRFAEEHLSLSRFQQGVRVAIERMMLDMANP